MLIIYHFARPVEADEGQGDGFAFLDLRKVIDIAAGIWYQDFLISGSGEKS
jgi:hypothetical protein